MTTMTHSAHRSHANGFNPLTWFAMAMATRKQRLHLEDLDDHMLADIGLDRYTARREAERSFWDIH